MGRINREGHFSLTNNHHYGKGPNTYDKLFAVCYTRQRDVGKEFFRKLILKIENKKRFNQGRTPPASHPPALPKSKVAAFFAHYAAGGIRTHDLLLTRLYFISFSTYYTKPSVNCLFEALNEFKLKSCPL